MSLSVVNGKGSVVASASSGGSSGDGSLHSEAPIGSADLLIQLDGDLSVEAGPSVSAVSGSALYTPSPIIRDTFYLDVRTGHCKLAPAAEYATLRTNGAISIAVLLRQYAAKADANIAYSAGSGPNYNYGICLGFGASNTKPSLYSNTSASGFNPATCAYAMPLGLWYHLAITRSADGQTVKFYLNGALIDTQVAAVPAAGPASSTTQAWFAAYNAGVGYDYTGEAASLLMQADEWSADSVLVLAKQPFPSLP